MDGADPRASEHGIGDFRNHRQIDGDPVAFLDVAVAQDVGQPAHLVVQLAIGDVLGLLGIVAFPDDRGLIGALGKMPVDAVVGGVEHAVLEPFDRDIARAEGAVLDLARCSVPVQALGFLGPKAVGVLERARVHLLVLVGVDIGAFLPLRRNVVDFLGHIYLQAPRRKATVRNILCCAGRRPKGSYMPLCDARRRSDKPRELRLWLSS